MKDLDWLFELVGMLMFRFGIKLNFEHSFWLYALSAAGLVLGAAYAVRRKKAKRAQDLAQRDPE